METEFRGTLRNAISGRENVTKLPQDLTNFTRDLKRTEAEIKRGVLGKLNDYDAENAAKANFNAKDCKKAMSDTTDLVRDTPPAPQAWSTSSTDITRLQITDTST